MGADRCKIVSRWAGLADSPPEWWWKWAATCLLRSNESTG